MNNLRFRTLLMLAAPLLFLSTGCAVPQPRGEGLYKFVNEPRNGAGYHLYLPKDYVKNNGRHPQYPAIKRWPLVMTFHGMKPYDNAKAQEREWEREADTYGYIVCSPQLNTSDSFMEYPLTKEHSYVLRDRENVAAIMDHVFETTMADPQHVLSTSWSCGGYLAHYFVNRFPERFSCIATRLSNFSSKLLVESTVPIYRDRVAVAIFIGDGDLPKCKSESQEAVAWYLARNFKVVRGKMIDDMGHRRIPQTAAAFFAETIGLQPLYPKEANETVSEVHMTEYYPPTELLARMSPPADATPAVASREPSRPQTRPQANDSSMATRIDRRGDLNYVNLNAGRNYPFGTTPLFDPHPDSSPAPAAAGDSSEDRTAGNWLEPVGSKDSPRQERQAEPNTRTAQAPRNRPAARSRDGGNQRKPATSPGRDDARPERVASVARPNSGERARRVNVRIIGAAVGTAPHYINFAVDLPPEQLEGADFLWTDNGAWICDEARGSKVLETPGPHQISLLMVSRDNVEYRGMATVHVLERGATASGKSADGAQ